MSKIGWVKGWIVLWIGLFLFGCATRQDVQILDAEANRLHSQLSTVQKEVESLKKDFSTYQKEVQGNISTRQKDDNALRADLSLRLDNLQSEVRILTAGVEEYKDFLKRPSKEVDRVKEEVALRTRILEERWKTFEERNRAQEERIKGIEERFKGTEDRLKGLDGKIDQVVSKQVELEKSAKETPPAEIKGPFTGAGNLYKEAYETFQKGDLEGARKKFEAFLKQYPNTELSDNAQFWIGETYYQKKDFEKAILEYEKAIAKYPEGDKVSALIDDDDNKSLCRW